MIGEVGGKVESLHGGFSEQSLVFGRMTIPNGQKTNERFNALCSGRIRGGSAISILCSAYSQRDSKESRESKLELASISSFISHFRRLRHDAASQPGRLASARIHPT